MTDSKYTPGPWVWRGRDGGLYQVGTTHRFGGAVLIPSYEYDSGIDTIVSEADMALIAAAPDLLEALKDCLDRFVTAFPTTAEYNPIKRGFAAIARAEGRS